MYDNVTLIKNAFAISFLTILIFAIEIIIFLKVKGIERHRGVLYYNITDQSRMISGNAQQSTQIVIPTSVGIPLAKK